MCPSIHPTHLLPPTPPVRSCVPPSTSFLNTRTPFLLILLIPRQRFFFCKINSFLEFFRIVLILYSPFGPFPVPSFGPSFRYLPPPSPFDNFSYIDSLTSTLPNYLRLVFFHRLRDFITVGPSKSVQVHVSSRPSLLLLLLDSLCLVQAVVQSLPFSSVQFANRVSRPFRALKPFTPHDIYETYYLDLI